VDRPFASALVTGGAGFIGSHLVDALLAAGVRTTVLDDLSSGSRDLVPAAATLVVADITDPAAAAAIADVRAELVIHAAAQVSVPVSVADPARDRAVNLEGTERVLAAARAGGCRRFVFISSGGAIYGDAPSADEDTLPTPANPYGIHKLAAEGYVRTSGLSWGIVRFSNVYGPRQRAGLEGAVVAVFGDALRTGSAITIDGDGEQTRDLLHVADAVSGTLAIAGAARDGTWNVSTGRATSVNHLLAVMEGILRRRVPVAYGPPREGDVRSSRLSPERMRAELGWWPAWSLEAGVATLLSSEPTA
jgi:UDP-glucose 4-epimerase